MIDLFTAQTYKNKVEKELTENILPFWIIHTVDMENGGFYGLIRNDITVKRDADKGSILCSRILWTFSTAYRVLGKDKYLIMAQRAYKYLVEYFWDKEYKGLYWMLDYKGNPVNTRKQIYAQAFGIYAFSEYYRATGVYESLDYAVRLFERIERYGYDPDNKGYYDAFTREWNLQEDFRMSKKEINAEKTMNTHLHVMEAYTNLLRVWDNAELRKKQRELIEITIEHIIDENTAHFKLFFDECWNPKEEHISYGHDIEGSWLLYEAAEVLGDEELVKKVEDISVRMAEATLEQGVDKDGGIYNEGDSSGVTKTDKDWWPQAEAAVGFLNAYQLTGDKRFLEASYKTWDFIDTNIVDKVHGEWFWKVSAEGKAYDSEPKVEPWKCPYHNSRACIEISERLSKI